MTPSKPAQSLEEWESSLADTAEDETTEKRETAEPEALNNPPAEQAPAEDSAASPATQDDDGEQLDEDEEEEAETPAPASAAAPAQPAPQSPPIETKPFRTRVDGKDLDLPGAIEANGFKVIPDETWARQIVPRLADRRALMERHKAELDAERSTKGLKEKRAELILDKLGTQLLASEDAAETFLSDFARNVKMLHLEVDNEMNAFERETGKQRAAQEDQSSAEDELRTRLQSTMEHGVDEILREAAHKDLGLDRGEILADMWEHRASLFRNATADDEGRTLGELVLDVNRMRRILAPAVKVAERTRQTQSQVDAAASANAKVLNRRQAPPAVASRGTPAAGGRSQKKPTSLQEWEDSLSA